MRTLRVAGRTGAGAFAVLAGTTALAGSLAMAGAAGATALEAQVPDPAGTLTVGELLRPCVEGADDARWGELLLTACDQYLRGFRDSWQALASQDVRTRLCLPTGEDPIGRLRRAFVEWASRHTEARGDPAVSGLIRATRERFPCP